MHQVSSNILFLPRLKESSYTTHLVNFFRLTLSIIFMLYVTGRILQHFGYLKEEIACDAETTVSADGKIVFKNGRYTFEAADQVTIEDAHSGKHSVKMTGEIPYAFTTELKGLKKGEELEITVWCKYLTNSNTGYPAIISQNTKGFYQGTIEDQIPKPPCGWFQIKQILEVPSAEEPLKIYCWNNSKETILVDDLTISRNSFRWLPEWLTETFRN